MAEQKLSAAKGNGCLNEAKQEIIAMFKRVEKLMDKSKDTAEKNFLQAVVKEDQKQILNRFAFFEELQGRRG